MRNITVFKCFGILTLLYELSTIFTIIMPPPSLHIVYDTQDIIRLLAGFLMMTIIGIGLIYERKWAAIGFSLATLYFGLLVILLNLFEAPFPANLLNIFVGIIFLTPTVITIALWSRLSWRGKKFLT